MKLPNGNGAIIDPRKLTEYSLNHDHDDGKHKARLFQELLGVGPDDVEGLLDAFREAAACGEATVGRPDKSGQRYMIDFDFRGPAGQASVRSAWIVSADENRPRLVTCYIL